MTPNGPDQKEGLTNYTKRSAQSCPSGAETTAHNHFWYVTLFMGLGGRWGGRGWIEWPTKHFGYQEHRKHHSKFQNLQLSEKNGNFLNFDTCHMWLQLNLFVYELEKIFGLKTKILKPSDPQPPKFLVVVTSKMGKKSSICKWKMALYCTIQADSNYTVLCCFAVKYTLIFCSGVFGKKTHSNSLLQHFKHINQK